nr:reverse transcriptase domain-containing protein [Tanacetum cinerariifolium]
MRTRNSYFQNNSFVTIPRRRNKRRASNIVEPELRTIVKVALMADNQTMEELLQAPKERYEEAIVIPEINADHFEIKTNLLQLVQANRYHGFERENPHTHINNFKRITSTLKFRDVPNDVIKLMMFPYSLEGAARVWYDKEPSNSILTWDDLEILRACPHHGFTELTQIDTFYDGLNENDQESVNAAAGGNILSKTTREALHIIENKSKFRYSRNKHNVSRMKTTSIENVSKTDDRIDKLADQISTLVDIVFKKVVTLATVKAVEESCVTYGGNPAYYNCDATNSNQSSVCAAMDTYNQVSPQNHARNHMTPPGFDPVQNTLTSSTLPSNTIPNPKGEMKAITTRSGVAYEGPSIPTNPSPKKVVERETKETTYKEQTNFQRSSTHIQPSVVPILKLDVSKTLPKPNIPYPSRLNDQKLREKATNQMEKFFQIFQDLHFDISFADALLLMPKFASTIKSLLANKDKLFELSKIPLNENCSTMLLKKLLEKLENPGKFLIPFVDFEANPRVPLILGRSFLRTGHALIDVYREEITLQVNDKAITFNLNQTMRYSSTYDDMSVNRIDVIDIAREEYAQEMLVFFNNSLGGNPTSTFEPIISDSSPPLTSFEGSDFILEVIDAYLKDESISPKIDHADSKAKSSIEEPLELELKDLPSHLEYAYLEGTDKLPVIIAKDLKDDEKESLLKEDYKTTVQSQRWVNSKIHEVIKKEVIKLLDAEMNYLISDSPWVSAIHCVPKKGGITVVENEINELILTRLVTDEFSRYFQIPINPPDQEKTTFTCPYGTFAYLRMPFGLCNAPGTFQRAIISDRGTHFFNDKFAKVMSKYRVTHRLATAYHPQTSRQVEVLNRGLKRILKRTVGENRISWSEKLKDALWAFRTAYKTPIGCTLYKLVYGKSCHLPIELEHKAYWALKHANFDLKTTDDHQKLQLNELNELHDQAYENYLICKEKTKKLYESKIKNRIFNVGDRVLLFNSRLKIFLGKLKTRWSGPFTLTQVFSYGTIELSQPEGPNFKVNGHRVKHYFGGDLPSKVVPDLQTFPMEK